MTDRQAGKKATWDSDEKLAACHCIISHPSEPKFLVIDHSTGWLPPVLRFPVKGWLVYNADMINRGMQRKYGMKTTLLRHLIDMPEYHCIELELQSEDRGKKLREMWVDTATYLQLRRGDIGEGDPFEKWLREQDSGEIPALRPPWERRDWFQTASNWFLYQVDKLGYQATGSVRQFKAAWAPSCLLTVNTAQGRIFFKAAYDKPPGEVALTLALAEKWPEYVPAPLVADVQQNWMLMPDFKLSEGNKPGLEQFPEIAGIFGRIQAGSVEFMEEWEKLDCPVHDLEHLSAFAANISELAPVLSQEGTGLREWTIERLVGNVPGLIRSCEQLAEYDIPDTLVHQDFRDDNIFLDDGRIQIYDWADTVIAHPFFSMFRVLEYSERVGLGKQPGRGVMKIEEPLLERVLDAYLGEFSDYGSGERLREAFDVSRKLQKLFQMLRIVRELEFLEPGCPLYISITGRLLEVATHLSREEID
jgi:hypothetical protein